MCGDDVNVNDYYWKIICKLEIFLVVVIYLFICIICKKIYII